MSHINFSYIITRVGQVFVLAGPIGVSRVIFGEKRFRDYLDGMSERVIEGGAAEEMAAELELYFEGKLTGFKTVIDISEGTPFQRAVWRRLLDIPYGEVITYKELAESIGAPGAARAVGNALGANPIPIVIPCHRVLASHGLGGYSPGVGIKEELLRMEGAIS